MTINIGKKFGKFLVDRESGKSAYDFFKYQIESMKKNEKINCYFDDVLVLNPSFCDEVFGQLEQDFPEKIILDKNMKYSMKVAFETVEETRGIKFNYSEMKKE